MAQQASLRITAAATSVARQDCVPHESLRRWRAQAEFDDGAVGTVSTSDKNLPRSRLELEGLRGADWLCRWTQQQPPGRSEMVTPVRLETLHYKGEGKAVQLTAAIDSLCVNEV